MSPGIAKQAKKLLYQGSPPHCHIADLCLLLLGCCFIYFRIYESQSVNHLLRQQVRNILLDILFFEDIFLIMISIKSQYLNMSSITV